jgi:hypothetical protein
MRKRYVLLALVATLLLSACTDDSEQGAVTVTDEGVLRVVHHPCGSDNVVRRLRLVVRRGGGDHIVLWKVIAVRPTTYLLVETFEPGNIPAGYRETVPFNVPNPGDKLVVYLDNRHGDYTVLQFVWGSLEPGTLVTEDGPKPGSEWLDYAIEGCGGT